LDENQIFDLGRKLLEKIKGGDLSQGFTLREIKRKKWSGFGNPEDIHEVLNLLVDYGYLNAVENTTGRRTTKFYFRESLENAATIETNNREPPTDSAKRCRKSLSVSFGTFWHYLFGG